MFTFRFRIACLLFPALFLSVFSQAQLNVTPNQTAQQLVDRLVGSNVTILNPVLTCAGSRNGSFVSTNTNLGLPGGIILATGDAGDLAGPWTTTVGKTGATTPGDADLSSLVNEKTTNDACVLEFDFLPDVDTVSTLTFSYVFGSEEYTLFTCSDFNDVFGFLLTGPNYNPTVNIAVVPGTNIPVAINSINRGTPSGGYQLATCQAMGPGSPFPQYYVDNEVLNGQTVSLNGFTAVLEATATVFPCDTYHMKLGIANVSDGAYQSAVFLQENSFTVDDVEFELSQIIPSDDGYLVEGCDPAVITATRSEASSTRKKICLSYGGTATNGVDYRMLPDSLIILPFSTSASLLLEPFLDNIEEPGYESVIIRSLNCCSLEPMDSVVFKLRDSLILDIVSVDTGICNAQTISLHATGDPAYTYQWTPDENVANPSDTLTTALVEQTTTYSVSAAYKSCPTVSRSFTVIVEPVPIVEITPDDTSFCLADPYPIHASVQPDTFDQFIYTWTPTIGLSDPTILEPYFFLETAEEFSFQLKVETPLVGCSDSDQIVILTRPQPTLTDVTADFTAKYGEVVQLNANGALYYTWTPDRLLDYPNTSYPSATALDSVTFQVIGTDFYGCRDTAYVKMDVDYTMSEFIPNAFTPNDDGLNDIFRIKNLKYQRLLEFRVFNRWGQELFSTQDPSTGWNGRFNGVPQEPGVYHYIIRIARPDGKMRVYQGDVTLLR